MIKVYYTILYSIFCYISSSAILLASNTQRAGSSRNSLNGTCRSKRNRPPGAMHADGLIPLQREALFFPGILLCSPRHLIDHKTRYFFSRPGPYQSMLTRSFGTKCDKYPSRHDQSSKFTCSHDWHFSSTTTALARTAMGFPTVAGVLRGGLCRDWASQFFLIC